MSSQTTSSAESSDYRGTTLLGIEVSLTSIALATTIVRITIRKLNRKIGWDDVLIIAAMTCRLVSFCFTMITLANGNGRHAAELQPSNITTIIKFTWLNEFFIFPTVALIKSSICLYILRIKKTLWLKRSLYTMMLGLALTSGSCMVILLAQCQPLYAYWDRTVGSCWDVNIYNGFIYAQVGYSIVTDLICSCLPAVILWKVKISRQIKLAVSGLMFLGLIATACGAVRAALSVNNESDDLTWSLVEIDYFAFSEADIGISAANLALSRMIYLYFTRDRFQKNKSRTDSSPTSDYTGYPSRGKATLHSQNMYSLLGHENQTEFSDQIPLTAVKKPPNALKNMGNGQVSGQL